MSHVVMECAATIENFDEAAYLRANPDILSAIKAGTLKSGFEHFIAYHEHEVRKLRVSREIASMQAVKLARIEPLLRTDMVRTSRGGKPDFLSDELRAATRISDTDRVSSNAYDGEAQALIEECRDGLVMDCGAGKRTVYYDNVVNFEIADYDTTDVLGVGEALPFKDDSFDAVLSIAVLEHVRDPFRCAREIVRVLKPGGRLFCSVPFLQPEHGFPHHYYNMAPQGLRALWEDMLIVDAHKVVGSMLPIWTLTWFLKSWSDGLSGEAQSQFMGLRVGDLISRDPHSFLEKNWVSELSSEKNMELACATLIRAHKQT